jgi:hypothetical protein
MWLEKFVFCGSTCGPTTNMQTLAERLALGDKISLGKHLLRAVYRMLHQVSARLATNQPPSNIGGPWWFLQLWLNLYIHKVIGKEIINQDFPADHLESATQKRRQCTNFGEAAFFRSFYNGFKDDATIWFAYGGPDVDQLERPYFFKFDRVCDPKDVSKIVF